MKKHHLGLGVVAVMSAKGTATLAATFLLPNWPTRFLAIAIILSIGTFAITRRRRRGRAADRARDTGDAGSLGRDETS